MSELNQTLEEPTRSKSKSIDDLPTNIWNQILEQLAWQDVIRCRRVCKKWESIVGSSKAIETLVFSVSNTPESLEALRFLLPSFKIRHFMITGVDLEKRLLAHQDAFQYFTKNHCIRIETLWLKKCSLGAGRFLELLAFCKRLKNLIVQDCPLVYRPFMGLIHWEMCFKSVKRNLAQVNNLRLMENFFSDENLYGLTCEMNSLESVNFNCQAGRLPIYTICNLFKKNSATLNEVTFKGPLYCKDSSSSVLKAVAAMPKMKVLKDIQINRGLSDGYDNPLILENLLGKCPALTALSISQTVIDKRTLSGVLDSLEELKFYCCAFSKDTFSSDKLSKLSKLTVSQLGNLDCSETTREAIYTLLKLRKPLLTHLSLNLVTEEDRRFVEILTPTSYPNLKDLSICCYAGEPELKGPKFRSIFTKFSGLESLSLFNCQSLVDDNICRSGTFLTDRSLSNMKNLRRLDLSKTGIGNYTVKDCILCMKKLESLRLDFTEVDEDGLREILTATKEKLTSLRVVNISHSACRPQPDKLAELRDIAPQVTVNCLFKS